MIPPHRRILFPRRVLLFTLVIVSALAALWPLALGARAASAAFAHPLLAGSTLMVSPTNLTGCRQCSVTVSNQSPNRSLTWFAVSRGVPGVVIHPAGGTLPRKGQVSVTITVPSNIACPSADTITFTSSANAVNVSWSCPATPTPSPTASPTTPTPTSTPASAPTQPPTPSVSLTPTASSPGSTPTAASVSSGGAQQADGNPPPTSGLQDSAIPSILLSIGALVLALCAFMLYLMSPAQTSLRHRLLSLVLPDWFLRRLDQNR